MFNISYEVLIETIKEINLLTPYVDVDWLFLTQFQAEGLWIILLNKHYQQREH